ncbi:3-oxoacyl-ACP synthase III family protein [Streptomyces sp. NPDC049577]|uniref:3-oxoacyl-ACP synthase III family protein n=1 Tax=Streptomyces sp. NPDC049577 TaxID=3155153 RepID=UPI0034323A44
MTHLVSAASALPGPPVGNDRIQERLGLSQEWIETFIGTRTRHFAVDLDSGEPGPTLADLCVLAAGRALDRAAAGPARLGPDGIAFVVLATATPDALMPTTAALVAERLGITGAPVYQLQSGCSGAVQAFALADALLTAGAPAGLVLGGDVCAKHLDLTRDFPRMPPGELVNYVLFGDGAGAAVVTAGPAGAVARLHAPLHHPALPGLPPGQRVAWYGAADHDRGGPPVTEDYKAIEHRVPELSERICAELLDRCGWHGQQLDYLLPPQLGGRMTAAITARLRDRLGAGRAEEISCVAETGNTGNALVLTQLERLLPLLAPGRRALCACVESSKWITAGFGLEAL